MQSIEKELLQRLQSGTYGDIYNFPVKEYEKVLAMEEMEAAGEEDEEEDEEVMSLGSTSMSVSVVVRSLILGTDIKFMTVLVRQQCSNFVAGEAQETLRSTVYTFSWKFPGILCPALLLWWLHWQECLILVPFCWSQEEEPEVEYVEGYEMEDEEEDDPMEDFGKGAQGLSDSEDGMY